MTRDEAIRRVLSRRAERVAFWRGYKFPATRKETQMSNGYEQRDNSGSLFRNDRRKNENHPHAKGKAMIGGQWYWVSAWTKDPRQGGEKFQSLAFEAMTEEQVEQYVNGGGGAGQQQRGGFGSRTDNAAGVNRPRSTPGRAEQDARSPRAADGGRGATQMPFGEEKVFQSSDIPF